MNDPTTSTDTNVSEFLDLDDSEYYVGTYDAWYGDDVGGIDSDPLDLGDGDIPF